MPRHIRAYLGLETVSRHYFLKFRRSEVSVSSRLLEVSENGHVSATLKGSFQN